MPAYLSDVVQQFSEIKRLGDIGLYTPALEFGIVLGCCNEYHRYMLSFRIGLQYIVKLQAIYTWEHYIQEYKACFHRMDDFQREGAIAHRYRLVIGLGVQCVLYQLGYSIIVLDNYYNLLFNRIIQERRISLFDWFKQGHQAGEEQFACLDFEFLDCHQRVRLQLPVRHHTSTLNKRQGLQNKEECERQRWTDFCYYLFGEPPCVGRLSTLISME